MVMTLFRVFLLAIALVFFFIVGAPLQMLLARRSPALAARLAIAFCRTLLGILRVSIDIAGSPERQGPVLLAVNHVSWIDVLALGSVMPFCFLAKHEVARWPILSAFAKVQGTVFVDRSRRRGIMPANRQMADRMLEGRIVLLFPEGTTYDGETPGRFHSSHFASARDLLRGASEREVVSVQPVALAYSSAAAAWIGDDALLPHLWRVLRGAPLRCLVTFGPALAYRRDTDRKVVARLSRAAIIAMLASARAERPLYAWTNHVPAEACDDPAEMPMSA
ncbi:1-acyl-sn-glycerol-3-phosphate acyltransferase [Beijerinckia sp. L45]|uniref:lysophospholipid acyltransferase family protein n=1 Tax=Beijerinckia sp. L45 TaxID=1641855 RepID=UPI00131B0077|nr:lysophospholipid acyltransferase family protein [Beijerinckia sp. L45]